MNKRTGVIACIGVFIIIMVMLFSRSCSIRRNEMISETNPIDDNGNIIAEEEGSSDLGQDLGQVEYDDSEEVGSLDSSDNDGFDEENTEDGVQENQKSVDNTEKESKGNTAVGSPTDSKEKKYEISLKKASKVTIVKSGSCEATITGKNVYLTDENVYSYCLKLDFTMEDGIETSIDYLCSVFTWNYVNTGDTVTVKYGLDADGNLLVTSLMNAMGTEF